jgi:NDMA-dependent alcohol dehydrogenase
MIESRAAILWEQPGRWQVSTVTLDEPGPGEVLVEMVATGLCHSDDHVRTGDSTAHHLPLCGGHEGAGIVRRVGPGVYGLAEGDHIVTSFIPSCGRCRWCAQGLQQLCDNGAKIMAGAQLDGTYRMHHGGTDVGTMAMLGTFSEWQVLDQLSCVKVRPDVPLETVCIVACAVPTGWGSAVNGGHVGPGDVVVVMGVGGIGINAVQGARYVGAAHVVAVDPVAFKREAALKLGATEAFSSMAEATDFVRSITNGQGADSAIVTVGVVESAHLGEAFAAIRKAGTVVVTSQGAADASGIPVSLYEISMFQKRIQGVLYGMSSPRAMIPSLVDLYAAGTLDLDGIITRRYDLDHINEAYADMHAGRNLRGVIEFRH